MRTYMSLSICVCIVLVCLSIDVFPWLRKPFSVFICLFVYFSLFSLKNYFFTAWKYRNLGCMCRFAVAEGNLRIFT